MQKQQEVYRNIVKDIPALNANDEITRFTGAILLIHLNLKQKSQVKLEIMEQKMLK